MMCSSCWPWIMIGLTSLIACEPAATDPLGGVDDRGDRTPSATRVAACEDGPGMLDGLPAMPVTIFYAGELEASESAEAASGNRDAVVVETATQREWSTLRWDWAPQDADFGNLDADRENAGHGVFLAARAASTCGLHVHAVEAWKTDDAEQYSTYVEMTVLDAGGDCDASVWAGAAVAVPIADFPFSGPVTGCVNVVSEGETVAD